MLRNSRKRRKIRLNKKEEHIPIVTASCSSPSLFLSKSETRVFMTSSSSKSSRKSSDPSSKDKSASAPRVADLGIEDGVTTKKEPSFTAWERAMKGLLADMIRGVVGEVLLV